VHVVHQSVARGAGTGGATAATGRRSRRLPVHADPPLGLIAYEGEVPVGWVATGPRSRYPRAIGPRVRILKERDLTEDDDVWLLPCFFVRVGYRRRGVTAALVTAAVDAANARGGAKAVEGFPIADASSNAGSLNAASRVWLNHHHAGW
jgi:GNAT superfamily N-acetyltransferase